MFIYYSNWEIWCVEWEDDLDGKTIDITYCQGYTTINGSVTEFSAILTFYDLMCSAPELNVLLLYYTLRSGFEATHLLFTNAIDQIDCTCKIRANILILIILIRRTGQGTLDKKSLFIHSGKVNKLCLACWDVFS